MAPTVQQLLAEQDGVKLTAYLMDILAAITSGKDLSYMVAEIAQGVLNNSKWSMEVKGLAYDLCRLVSLSDADCQHVISGLKADLSSSDPDLVAQALGFLPHLQPHLLANLLASGQLSQMVGTLLVSDSLSIRAAVVQALAEVLLLPEVLQTAASSASLANQVNEHWQGLTDALLDEEEAVVAAAVSAANALLKAGLAADTRGPEGFLLERLSFISAARISSALAAILHASSELRSTARVEQLSMLGILVELAVKGGQWSAADVGGAAGLPAGTTLPGLHSLAPAVWSHCTDALRSGHAHVQFEAASTIIKVAAFVSKPPPGVENTSTIALGPAPVGGTGVAIPTALVLEAVEQLLVIEGSLPLAEAASEQLMSAAVAGMAVLPLAARAPILQRLWAAIGRVKSSATRVQLCMQAWAAVVNAHEAQQQQQQQQQQTKPQAQPSAIILGSESQQAAGVAELLVDLLGKASTSPAPAVTTKANSGASGSAATAAASSTQAPAPAAVAASTNELLKSKAPAGNNAVDLSRIDSKLGGSGSQSRGKGFLGRFKGSGKQDTVADLGESISAESSRHSNNRDSAASQALQMLQDKAAAVATAVGFSGDSFQKQEKAPVPGAQRHEVLSTLLFVLHHHHPHTRLAAQLCADVAAAAAHDQAVQASLGHKYGSWQLKRVLSWVSTCRMALQKSSACLLWEPQVVPAITHHVNPTTAQRPPADYSHVVQDAWLQLLQAAAASLQAVRELQKVLTPPGLSTLGDLTLKRAHSEAQPETPTANAAAGDALQTQPSGASDATASTLPGTKSGFMAPVNPLATLVNEEHRELSSVMKQVLRDWANLSRAVKPRALWVVSHSLDMAPHADEQWELGMKALHDTLCKLVASGSISRLTEVLNSAGQGVLFQSGRLGFPRDRQFVFDSVAASALCERPDYEAAALYTALAAAQAWALRLQDALASCSEDAAKRVSADVLFQAGRMEGVLREFMATWDAQGSPVLREWCKRVMRQLAAAALFVHPAIRAQEEAEKAAKEAEEKAAREADDDSSSVASGSSGSSSSSGFAGDTTANLLPVSLPTSMYLPRGPAGQPRPALAPVKARPGNAFAAAGGVNSFLQPNTPLATLQEQASFGLNNGFAGVAINSGSPMQRSAGGGAARDQDSFKNRAAFLQGNLPAHMVVTSSRLHPWGYPFAPGPRSTPLYLSRRSKRARTLNHHLVVALGYLNAEPHGTSWVAAYAGAEGGLHGGATFPAHSVLRLDNPTFWQLLPSAAIDTAMSAANATSGGAGYWPLVRMEELCGAADPLLLVAGIVRGADLDQLQIKLTVINRTDIEVRGAVVNMFTYGPAQLDRRAVSWSVPRLLARDRTTTTFTLKILGYAPVSVQARLQLVMSGSGTSLPTPVSLCCRPLACGLVHHMLLPPQPSVRAYSADDFFRTWSVLPARAEMSGACVWPGREGAAVAISCMLRTPLSCITLTYLPAAATYTATLAGETVDGEPVLLLVHIQLLPPASVPSSAAAVAAPQTSSSTSADHKSGASDGAAATQTPTQANGEAADDNDAHKDQKHGKTAGRAVLHEAERGPADSLRAPRAVVHVAIRSSLPDMVLAVQSQPSQFLQDLTAGSIILAGMHWTSPALLGAAGSKPPLHPRVAALDAAHTHSIKALPTPVQALLGGTGGTQAAVDVYAQGSKARTKVSHKWMEEAALAEWQRLIAQPL